jgi:WD40 repeat protein
MTGLGPSALRVWDLDSGRELHRLNRGDFVQSIVVTPDGRRAISGAWLDPIRVWDLESGSELRQLATSGMPRTLLTTPDGKHVIGVCSPQDLGVWKIATGRRLRTLRGHEAPVGGLARDVSGDWIISGSADRTVRWWHLTREGTTAVCLDEEVTSLAASSDGTTLVAGDAAGNVYCLRHRR